MGQITQEHPDQNGHTDPLKHSHPAFGLADVSALVGILDDVIKKRPRIQKIEWPNVFYIFLIHVVGLFGITRLFDCSHYSLIWAWALFMTGGLSITAGTHRLWAHKSYKARFPLRFAYIVWNCSAYQGPILQWVRDHRVHHKYTETDADPHNIQRGFFYAHVGWQMMRKHPATVEKGGKIDMSDLLSDPLLVFQKKYYPLLVLIFCFVMPTIVPYVCWGESLLNSFLVCGVLRYTILLNITFCINSWAHMFGTRPYDKRIQPVDTKLLAAFALGEGYHNFHHTFPQDYRTGEFGWKFNVSGMFIDLMALIGLATDLKKIPDEAIRSRILKNGRL